MDQDFNYDCGDCVLTLQGFMILLISVIHGILNPLVNKWQFILNEL